MNIRISVCSFVLLLSIFLCADVYTKINGKVTDTAGNPVEGALVTFTNEWYDYVEFSGYTNDAGFYQIDLTSGVEDTSPKTFSLGQNYPNPFNPTTTIPYSLESPGHINLVIYNIMGQKITALNDSILPAGEHAVKWDASGHGSSVYLYRLKADWYTETKKMTLIK